MVHLLFLTQIPINFSVFIVSGDIFELNEPFDASFCFSDINLEPIPKRYGDFSD